MAQVGHHAERTGRGANIASADSWAYILQHVSVLAIFVAAIFLRHDTGQTWLQSWSAVFAGLGILCLGFGAGMLFYQRRQRADAASLRNEYAELSTRVRMLNEEMDDFIKRKHPSGS